MPAYKPNLVNDHPQQQLLEGNFLLLQYVEHQEEGVGGQQRFAQDQEEVRDVSVESEMY